MIDGFREIEQRHKAINFIAAVYKRKKLNKKMLLLEMGKHEESIIKIQGLIRGWKDRKIWLPHIKMVQKEKKNKEMGMAKIREGLDDDFEDDLNDLNDFFHEDKLNNEILN